MKKSEKAIQAPAEFVVEINGKKETLLMNSDVHFRGEFYDRKEIAKEPNKPEYLAFILAVGNVKGQHTLLSKATGKPFELPKKPEGKEEQS